MHEFGHSVHFHSFIPGVGARIGAQRGPRRLQCREHRRRSRRIGRGFFFTNDPSRDIDPVGKEYSWPGDESPDPHVTGLIISGALWDSRKALIRQLGEPAGVTLAERIFVGVLQRASDIPTSYMAALVADDDDDGDLGNGTRISAPSSRRSAATGLLDAGFPDHDGRTTRARWSERLDRGQRAGRDRMPATAGHRRDPDVAGRRRSGNRGPDDSAGRDLRRRDPGAA